MWRCAFLEMELSGISELDAAIQVCHTRKYHPNKKLHHSKNCLNHNYLGVQLMT